MHVKRIYHVDADGTKDESTYIDVLRIDQVRTALSGLPNGQAAQTILNTFAWKDDPSTGGGENANPARKTEVRTIYSPDDQTDDTTAVQLRIINSLRTQTNGTTEGFSGQTVVWSFQTPDPTNTNDQTVRTASILKIVNNDLGGTDLKDSNDTLSWEDYKKLLDAGTTDDSSYLNVQSTYRFRCNYQTLPGQPPSFDTGGGAGQTILFALDLGNEELKTRFGDGNPQDDASHPVIWTDPLQVIVNHNFGGLAVEVFDGAS
jgi:hypothetical protein